MQGVTHPHTYQAQYRAITLISQSANHYTMPAALSAAERN